ncbi:MAG TPA: AI-2E family transporter [Candidatus Micrarchaeia archaeon]|nr:AI-2E family transporter [Candidatus Micrarchaeia archaeon]
MATPSRSRPGAEPIAPGAKAEASGEATPPAPGPQHRTWLWVRAAAVLLSVFLGYQLLLVVTGWLASVLGVILALVLAIVVTFLADPLVLRLRRAAGIPAPAAILLTLIGGLVLVAGVLYLVGGPLVGEARGLAGQVPHLVREANHTLNTLRDQLRSRGIRIHGGILPTNLANLVPQATGVLLHGVSSTATALVDVVVALVIAFWLLKDGRLLRGQLLDLLPSRLRGEVGFGLDAFEAVIGGYVRAQLLLALIVAVLAGTGSAILGVPFPLVVAVATFAFELIPLVGPFAGGAVAILLALTKSPLLAVFTLILFLAIHVIEGYLLAPRIQARFVHLHPLLALIALFTGIEVGGFLGALFAIPVASLVAVFIRAAVLDWRHTRPDLFSARGSPAPLSHSERRLLREFTPMHVDLRAWWRRRRQRGGDGPSPAAARRGRRD